MNAEGGIVLMLGVIFGVPLLLGLLRLLNWLAGRTLVPLWLPIVLLIVLPLAGSLYLDSFGERRSLKVLNKHETIKYGHYHHGHIFWSRELSVQVEQPWSDHSLSPFLSLSADPAAFDALRIGQPAEVRVVEMGSLFKFGRLASRSTISMIAGLLPRHPRGPWREATATIEQISNVTEYVERTPNTRLPLRWPYQIIRLSFTPPGNREAVEVVDNIEIGSKSGVLEKAVMPITWPEDDPRAAYIAGARPGRPWVNWIYFMGEELAIAGVALAMLVAFSVWWGRAKKKKLSVRAAAV
jgi:hypothetical protein